MKAASIPALAVPPLRALAAAAGVLAAAAASAATTAAPAAMPRHLLVQVRDTPPQGHAAVRHGADGSYSVSTGGSGERDERGAQAPDNGTTLSTDGGVRRVHLLEGQRVRVDLPMVQSLQFHVPLPSGAAAGGSAAGAGARHAPTGAAGAATATAASGTTANTTASTTASGANTAAGTAAQPSASGVVYFDAVAAFAARFTLAGRTVRIELRPLRSGTVAAPYAAAAGGDGTERPVVVVGRVGEWIALGDTELQAPAGSLNATSEPPSPASVWVRVDPEPAEAER